MKRLTKEQSKIVEEHYLAAMNITNKYWDKNKTLLSDKKISLEDLEQIALMKMCEKALRIDETSVKFITTLYNELEFAINREVFKYNIVKIPRPDDWDLEMHKNNKEQFATILHGIVELDKPIMAEHGEMATLETIESQLTSETKIDYFKEDVEDIFIKDVLERYFNSTTVEMLLLYIEDYSITQISERLNIKRTSLVNKLYKAKAELKNYIERDCLFGYNGA